VLAGLFVGAAILIPALARGRLAVIDRLLREIDAGSSG
jgi:hypothetical protein